MTYRNIKKDEGFKGSEHCMFKIGIHVVFVCKYRRKFMEDENIKRRISEVFDYVATELNVLIIKQHVADEHVHLLLSIRPSQRISDLVGRLKAKSSVVIRKEFPHLKKEKAFWSSGYFVCSVGAGSRKAAERYIEEHKNRK